MSNYLIELSIIHVILMLGYWFFLRKERQYAKMRFYLLGSTLLALIIPLIKLPKLFSSDEPMYALPLEVMSLEAVPLASPNDASPWGYDSLALLYIAVSVFFLLKFLGSILYLAYLERKSSLMRFDDLLIRKTLHIKGSFTFFNWIFLGDEIDQNRQDYKVMLNHEKAHALMGHTYDLMFLELFKICFWGLPTTWFVLKEIKKIHEYQADAYALKWCTIDQYSSILISSTLKSNGLGLASSFHDGLILKRLKAMNQQAKNVSPWKLGALSALCALLFVVFACSESANLESQEIGSGNNKTGGEVFTVVEDPPVFEGGMDAFYKYVRNEINYPLQARKLGVEGRVDVQFVVEKDGSLTDVEAIRGIGAGCDLEAVRVVQDAPSFKPGKQRGKAVRVQMVMPIVFKLNKVSTNADNSAQGIIVIEEAETNQGRLKVDARYANGKWSGTVYSPEGEKLPGTNIVVAGTTTGTVADLEGNFSLKTDASHDLHVSFVGYESVRLQAK